MAYQVLPTTIYTIPKVVICKRALGFDAIRCEETDEKMIRRGVEEANQTTERESTIPVVLRQWVQSVRIGHAENFACSFDCGSYTITADLIIEQYYIIDEIWSGRFPGISVISHVENGNGIDDPDPAGRRPAFFITGVHLYESIWHETPALIVSK